MKTLVKGFVISLILFFGFCLFILSNHIGGWRSFIVMSGSMEPTIATGSLVFTHYEHPSTLQKDDIITFIRPAKERDLITHRIYSLKTTDEMTTITTKGDSNKVTDPWTLAGGGVVGKVVFTLPFMGFFMAFLSSKMGIFLFVLVPSVYIIVEEIQYIKGLFKNRHKQRTEHVEVIAMVAVMLTATALTFNSTYSLLSDSAELTNIHFTLAQSDPTVTPTQIPTIIPTQIPIPSSTPCGISTTVIIKDNGAGSTNTVVVNNSGCTSQIGNQSNNTSSSTTINTSSNTGGNVISGNTGNTSIITGNISSTISTIMQKATNSANYIIPMSSRGGSAFGGKIGIQ